VSFSGDGLAISMLVDQIIPIIRHKTNQ